MGVTCAAHKTLKPKTLLGLPARVELSEAFHLPGLGVDGGVEVDMERGEVSHGGLQEMEAWFRFEIWGAPGEVHTISHLPAARVGGDEGRADADCDDALAALELGQEVPGLVEVPQVLERRLQLLRETKFSGAVCDREVPCVLEYGSDRMHAINAHAVPRSVLSS